MFTETEELDVIGLEEEDLDGMSDLVGLKKCLLRTWLMVLKKS